MVSPLRPFLLAALLAVLLAGGAIAPADAATGKAFAPIPAATLGLMQAKGTTAQAPVLFRAYKKESEIEVWKRAAGGRFVLVKTFPICRWSGQLGPKRKTGDRQTPEGFYTVPQRQMNPNSSYYLSFDVGYPNAYDRAHGSTGSAVMVHGVCSSMGCFAMTDAVVGEIYAIAREAFAGGQAAFQFQSYPFRMTAQNMARHRTDPNIEFWRQLKAGSDRFEALGEEPAVSVVAGRYAFAPDRDPVREARVAAHRADEEARIAQAVEDGSAAVRTTYSDGGQHAFWAAHAARGGSLGEVSRPEALAYAGLEVVTIPARPRVVVAEAVWSRWLGPALRTAFARSANLSRPAEAGRFGPLLTAYADTLPRMVRASLAGTLPVPGGLVPQGGASKDVPGQGVPGQGVPGKDAADKDAADFTGPGRLARR
ncbi:MAG: murein L,D-transpeptidase family protein [Methylobacterium sp.]|uniref:L,D-transpeptidase family protein n=1 Tax=Methylobacterium sp. TaxID=409 RepID=UPI00271F95CD|nr:murein L,D-transpeptidase family protein [Methylobacterium sp.]MDO9426050.1 murein L,D-transpeptidase family protein [Methylobacterium sp.]